MICKWILIHVKEVGHSKQLERYSDHRIHNSHVTDLPNASEECMNSQTVAKEKPSLPMSNVYQNIHKKLIYYKDSQLGCSYVILFLSALLSTLAYYSIVISLSLHTHTHAIRKSQG